MNTTQTRRALQKAILDLPLGQLAKFSREGINGEPLHRALGFSQEQEFKQWLFKMQAGASTDQTGNNSSNGEDEEIDDSSEDDDDDDDDKQVAAKSRPALVQKKRANRDVPVERSSKIRVSRFREVVPVPRVESRDPRFSHQELNHSLVRHRYEFLQPLRDAEIVSLRNEIRKQDDLRSDTTAHSKRRKVLLSEEELASKRAALTKLEQNRGDLKRAEMYQAKLHEVKKKTKMVSAKTKKQLKLQVRFEDLAGNEHRFKRFVEKKRKESEFKVRRDRRKEGGSGSGPALGI